MAMKVVKAAAVRSCLDDPWDSSAAATSGGSLGGAGSVDDVRNMVRDILDDVNANGDAAVTKYAQKFDGSTRVQHMLSSEEIEAALALTPPQVQADIKQAQSNIRRFALAQRATMLDLEYPDPEQPGVTLGHKHIPISRVGCYIPGGRFPIIAAACMQVSPLCHTRYYGITM